MDRAGEGGMKPLDGGGWEGGCGEKLKRARPWRTGQGSPRLSQRVAAGPPGALPLCTSPVRAASRGLTTV